MADVSSQVVSQRVRNRLYEECKWFQEFEQDDYPFTYDLINDWYDWWHDEAPEGYDPPVFTEAEVARLVAVGRAMDAFSKTIPNNGEPPKSKICPTHEWQWLVHTAELATLEMDKRGPFSEEAEETFN